VSPRGAVGYTDTVDLSGGGTIPATACARLAALNDAPSGRVSLRLERASVHNPDEKGTLVAARNASAWNQLPRLRPGNRVMLASESGEIQKHSA
jgi:hypothetical protein